MLVLVTVRDRCLGSGSRSELNCCDIGGPSRQYTQTSNSGIVSRKSPNPSEMGGLLAGCPPVQSVDSFDARVCTVWQWCVTKIMYSTYSNYCLQVLELAISIIVGSVVFLLYVVFLPIMAVNGSGMSSNIHAMPSLCNMQDQILLTLCWFSLA